MSGAKQISDHLRKYLECPICFEVRKGGKIFQCKNGHIACEACYSGLRTCSECRVGLTHPGMRNIQMEKLVESLPHQCRHFEAGCTFVTTEGNGSLKTHESDCLFKVVPCPHTSCDIQVPLAQLEFHVTSLHKANVLDCTPDGLITVEWPANIDLFLNHWKLSFIMLNGIMLFPILFKKDNMYYVWLAASAPLNGNVDIWLKGQKGNVNFTGRVLTVDTPTDDITSNPLHILTFTNFHAQQCMTKNGQGLDVLIVTFKFMMGEFGSVATNFLTGAAKTLTSTADRTKGDIDLVKLHLFEILYCTCY
jgi:hypothetical protein